MAASSPPMLHGTPLRPSRRPRSGKDGEGQQAASMRRGLIPRAKNPAARSRMTNAGAGTVAEKPAFRRRHCRITLRTNGNVRNNRGRSTPAPDPGNNRNAAEEIPR